MLVCLRFLAIPQKHTDCFDITLLQNVAPVMTSSVCTCITFCLSQAFLFYIPSHLWRALNSKSGIDSDNILQEAYRLARCADPDKRRSSLLLVRNQIHYFVSNSRLGERKTIIGLLQRCLACLCSLWSGAYLIMLYIFVKLLYVANIFLQLSALSYVLKTDFSIFGLHRFLSDEQMQLEEEKFINNPIFPKVTMCDVHIRTLGNNQRYTKCCDVSVV